MKPLFCFFPFFLSWLFRLHSQSNALTAVSPYLIGSCWLTVGWFLLVLLLPLLPSNRSFSLVVIWVWRNLQHPFLLCDYCCIIYSYFLHYFLCIVKQNSNMTRARDNDNCKLELGSKKVGDNYFGILIIAGLLDVIEHDDIIPGCWLLCFLLLYCAQTIDCWSMIWIAQEEEIQLQSCLSTLSLPLFGSCA